MSAAPAAALARITEPPLRSRNVRALVARRVAARSLVLLFHRVGPDGPAPHEVVPTVPTELFERQLDALVEVGDIVALGALDRPADTRRPRFALTFDDDDPGHARTVLPVLVERGLEATFFLSGRWAHGLGPYWWEILEQQILADGVERVARRLGVAASSPRELAAALEGTPVADALSEQGETGLRDSMTADDARSLAEAGMTIGFHTLEHRVMPQLPDDELDSALVEGRQSLSETIDGPVELFAYPHGRARRREAQAVAMHGFRAAWTTVNRPVDAAVDPYLRGRWEPAVCEPAQLVRGALQRLARRPVGAERG